MQNLSPIPETELVETSLYDALEKARPSEMELEIVRLTEELDTERERSLRVLAELDRHRRARREQTFADENAKRAMLRAFLEVMDDFDRALLHIGEAPDAVADGVRFIRRRFSDVLAANGVKSFESRGKLFDPTVHDALTVIERAGEESGTIDSEHRRGYFLDGKLLRPAQVAVVK